MCRAWYRVVCGLFVAPVSTLAKDVYITATGMIYLTLAVCLCACSVEEKDDGRCAQMCALGSALCAAPLPCAARRAPGGSVCIVSYVACMYKLTYNVQVLFSMCGRRVARGRVAVGGAPPRGSPRGSRFSFRLRGPARPCLGARRSLDGRVASARRLRVGPRWAAGPVPRRSGAARPPARVARVAGRPGRPAARREL